jgi:putative ABC transport system permease protein
MIRNYLKIAYRNLLKNQGFSLINIIGLSTAMTAAFLIFYYLSFELSFDDHHRDAERIYRVALDKYQGENERIQIATNYNALPKAMRENVAEVSNMSMSSRPVGNFFFTRNIDSNPVQFKEESLLFADEYFFDIFSHEWLVGDPASALLSPYSLVLTETVAARYFGSDASPEEIVGQALQVSFFNHNIDFSIRGIIEDVPANTHLPFDILLSASTFEDLYPEDDFENNWEWYDTYVYVRSQEHVPAEQLFANIQALLEQNSEAMGEGESAKSQIILQPLTDIHLHSQLQMEAEANGSFQQVLFLAILAFGLLLVSGLNYVNLQLVQSLKRVREVGIRKFIGANKKQLSAQAFTETLLLLLIALLFSFTAVQLLLPMLKNQLGMDAQNWLGITPLLLALPLFILLFMGLISAYPAYFMASFEPLKAINGRFSGRLKMGFLQKGMVGLQLMVATLTLAFTGMLYQQNQYMQQQRLGFNDQLLVFSAPTVHTEKGTEEYLSRVQTLKQELEKSGLIQQVTASTHVPGLAIEYSTSKVFAEGQDESSGVNMNVIGIDDDFINTYDLQILAGQNFPEEPNPDQPSLIINEMAASTLGFRDAASAVGEYVVHHGRKKQISAVVNNYHQRSLKEAMIPLAFTHLPGFHEYFSVKINASETNASIDEVGDTFQQVFPDNPFVYYFLDEAFQASYAADRQYNFFFNIFSCLIIFIACLGLLGIASFTAQQKTKEIGIRKVLGASVGSIIGLLTTDFMKLTLLAGLLALPVAYWAMNEWLQNYAFRIEISWWLLVFPLVVVLLLALLTVGIQTVRAAFRNPVKSLRCE